MTFNNIPPEIILKIASYLLPSQLLNFAHLNSLTYQTVHGRLLPIFSRQRNRQEMIRRFGKPFRDVGQCKAQPAICMAANTDLIDFYYGLAKSTITDLEHLRLDGDLYWLKPLPEDLMAEHKWPQGNAASGQQLDSLLDAASRMGVELPRGFVEFMRSQSNINCMYLGGDYFQLAPGMIECLGEDDKNGNGFVIRFYCDQQCCGFWALYVAPGGYHCVLYLAEEIIDWYDEEFKSKSDQATRVRGEAVADDGINTSRPVNASEEKLEEAERSSYLYNDIPLASRRMECSLEHTDFEEWLCMKYFNGWISATLEADQELEPRQKKYLEHVWLKKGFAEAVSDHRRL